MQHRGEIIKEAVYKSGLSITQIAKRMGKSRKWTYNMFENNSVSLDVVLQIGKIINHNFTNEINDLHFIKKSVVKTSSEYLANKKSSEYWKDKYLILLEEYNDLLKENNNILGH